MQQRIKYYRFKTYTVIIIINQHLVKTLLTVLATEFKLLNDLFTLLLLYTLTGVALAARDLANTVDATFLSGAMRDFGFG